MKYFVLLLNCLFFITVSPAQSCLVDSLEKRVQIEFDDYKNAALKVQLAEAYYNSNSEKAKQFTKETQKIAIQKKYTDIVTYTHIALSHIYNTEQKYDSASREADTAIVLAESIQHHNLIGLANFRKAQYFEHGKTHEDSLIMYYYKALAAFELSKNELYIVKSYTALARYFSFIGDMEREEKYARLAYAVSSKSKNMECQILGATIFCLYLHHVNITQQHPQQKITDSIFTLVNKSNELNSATTCIPKDAYVDLLSKSTFFCIMQHYKFHSFAADEFRVIYTGFLANAFSRNQYGSVIDITLTGVKYYIDKKDFITADSLLRKIEPYILYINNHERYYWATQLYMLYTTLYTKQQQYETAFTYRLRYDNYTDSLKRGISIIMVKDTELEEAFAKKEYDRLVLSNATTKSKKRYLYTIIGCIAFLAILFYMFRSYYFKQRAAIAKEQLLFKEKQETILLAKIKEEEMSKMALEKIKMERASVALIENNLLNEAQKNTLQIELLNNKNKIELHNELLIALQQDLPNITQGEQAIFEQHNAINNTADAIDIEDTYPYFFEQLQQQANNTLTELDLKYCAYIKMGMGNKKMASLLNIENKSISMAKYRIKQKLQLRKDDDLEKYIENI